MDSMEEKNLSKSKRRRGAAPKPVLEERNGKMLFFGVPVKVRSRSSDALIVTQDRAKIRLNFEYIPRDDSSCITYTSIY